MRDYESVWLAMKEFTDRRDESTVDELWMLEHPSVYTLGLNGDPGDLLKPTDIPLLRSDRGGQITFHGPGQLVAYVLLDLRRCKLGIRSLVTVLENSVVSLLGQYGLSASGDPDAPGVYVEGSKIASVGLRVRRGCSYHGLSLNVNPDLSAFSLINPCGFKGLKMTSLDQHGVATYPSQVAIPLASEIIRCLREACE